MIESRSILLTEPKRLLLRTRSYELSWHNEILRIAYVELEIGIF
jgi:hypothetical protein